MTQEIYAILRRALRQELYETGLAPDFNWAVQQMPSGSCIEYIGCTSGYPDVTGHTRVMVDAGRAGVWPMWYRTWQPQPKEERHAPKHPSPVAPPCVDRVTRVVRPKGVTKC